MLDNGGADAYWQEDGSRANDAGVGVVGRDGRRPVALKKGAVASELFIAQVTKIEALASIPMLPLLYHRRKFTSCIPCPPDPLS